MPGWAYGMRVEDVGANFDVFSLGKVLWSMISGKPKLRLWYYDKPDDNLETMFPHASGMSAINDLLSKCVVENEVDCLPDADAFLREIDNTLQQIRMGTVPVLDTTSQRRCRICSQGHYRPIVDQAENQMFNFGITPRGGRKHRIFACGDCGHVEWFFLGREGLPERWKE